MPTDLQAQFTAVLALARGRSLMRDAIFPRRFQHVPRVGPDGGPRLLPVAGGVAIDGVARSPARCRAPCDLRASAALVLAGLAARGRTLVRGLSHLDRGYRGFDAKLAGLGAAIERTEIAAAREPARTPRNGFARVKHRLGSGRRDNPAAGGPASQHPAAFGLTRPGQSPRL